MPSPFPGMDPYLESQGWWQDFHTSSVVYCRMLSRPFSPTAMRRRLRPMRRPGHANDQTTFVSDELRSEGFVIDRP